MKNVVAPLLAIAAVILSLFAYSQKRALRRQQRELLEKRDSVSKTASLDLHDKCARQAHEDFKDDYGLLPDAMGFTNHYNANLRMCFILVDRMDMKAMPRYETWSESLYDAFDGSLTQLAVGPAQQRAPS
jgi:hypothetical protein